MKIQLYRSKGTGNGFEVWQKGQYRWLIDTNQHIHTCINMDDPYQPMTPYLPPMMQALNFVPQAKSALILGLGGGAMLHYLRHFDSNLTITAIEKEPEIAFIAKQYFAVNLNDKNISVHIMDAFDFLKSCRRKFDIIFVDIFGSDCSANAYLPEYFYQFCASCLTSKGAIAINSICHNQSDVAYVASVINRQFDQNILSIPVENHMNLISIASKNKSFHKVIKRLCKKRVLSLQSKSPVYGLIGCAKKSVKMPQITGELL